MGQIFLIKRPPKFDGFQSIFYTVSDKVKPNPIPEFESEGNSIFIS